MTADGRLARCAATDDRGSDAVPDFEQGAWLYPWDVWRMGAAGIIERVAAVGLREIRVAVAYHPVRYRVGGRWVERPDDRVFVPMGRGDPGGVEPILDEQARDRGEWLPALVEAGRQAGVRVMAWLVLFNNRTLARRYPAWAPVDAWGRRGLTGLCPTHEAVRDYARRLFAAVIDRGVSALVWEACGFSPAAFSGPVPRSFAEALQRLCFCPGCQRALGDQVDFQAAAAGVRQVTATVGSLAAPTWVGVILQDAPEIGRLVAARAAYVATMWHEWARALQSAEVQCGAVGRWPATSWDGYSPRALDGIDEFTQLFYNTWPADVAAWRWLGAQTRTRLVCGLRIAGSAARVARQVADAQRWGIQRIVWYNLSRVPSGRWAWLAAAGRSPAPR